MIDEKKYPQLAKMQEVNPRSEVVGEFLDWLEQNSLFIGRYIIPDGFRREVAVPISDSTEQLLAQYFKIDLKAVERERQSILDEVRKGAAT